MYFFKEVIKNKYRIQKLIIIIVNFIQGISIYKIPTIVISIKLVTSKIMML